MSSIKKVRIAGVVVLFNPQPDIISNIYSYLDELGRLFVVDNSIKRDDQYYTLINRIKETSKVVYIDNGSNVGIAKALNIGAERAVSEEFDFLLTMDQDSSFPEHGIRKLVKSISELSLINVGILAPNHSSRLNVINESDIEEVRTTMTSGNLLNLQAFQNTGLFREEYFIDYVDHEYCIRLRKNGYQIIQLNSVDIIHKLGNITRKKILGITIAFTDHEPIRRYYITRNRMRMVFEQLLSDPIFCFNALIAEFEELFKIILLEDRKYEKLRYLFRGFKDFLIGKFGKYE
jgi:rhamnosyltransferase